MAGKLKFRKRIINSVLKGSLNTSSFVFSSLVDLGSMTIEAFLNPSIYADMDGSVYNYQKFSKKIKPEIETIRQNLYRLQKMGIVEKKGARFFLSNAGKEIAGYILSRSKINQKKWDGQYRLVIFDIPEKMRAFRNWLRSELYLLDYKQLQKSVFIGKHPLPKDLIEEINISKMGKHINYLTTTNVYDNKFAE